MVAFTGVQSRWEDRGSLRAAAVPDDHILPAHQENLHAQTPGGRTALRLTAGRSPRPLHPAQWPVCWGGLLCNHFDNFATLRAAFRTNAWKFACRLGLKARMLRHRGRGGCSSASWVSTFWIRYISTSNFVQLLPFARASQIFRVPDSGARPSDRPQRVYNARSNPVLPKPGQIPLQSHGTRCMGS
jgi:hypothetical protein